MDRQEKACKKFMVSNLMVLGLGLFTIALTMCMGIWDAISKDISTGFLFLGFCMVVPSISSLIPIIFAMKWVKDENDIKFLLKRLKITQKALELVAIVILLFGMSEFCHLVLRNQDEDGDDEEDGDSDDDGDEDGDEEEMHEQLGALILSTILTFFLWIYYLWTLIRWIWECQEVIIMARQEQDLPEYNTVPSASVDAQNVGTEEEHEHKDVEEGQENALPAYDDLFPEEDATHPYFYKMLQSV